MNSLNRKKDITSSSFLAGRFLSYFSTGVLFTHDVLCFGVVARVHRHRQHHLSTGGSVLKSSDDG